MLKSGVGAAARRALFLPDGSRLKGPDSTCDLPARRLHRPAWPPLSACPVISGTRAPCMLQAAPTTGYRDTALSGAEQLAPSHSPDFRCPKADTHPRRCTPPSNSVTEVMDLPTATFARSSSGVRGFLTKPREPEFLCLADWYKIQHTRRMRLR